jgi:hypothetical protein
MSQLLSEMVKATKEYKKTLPPQYLYKTHMTRAVAEGKATGKDLNIKQNFVWFRPNQIRSGKVVHFFRAGKHGWGVLVGTD